MTTQSPSRKRTPKVQAPVLLRRRGDGQVEALSSDGTTVYTLRIGETVQCECKGFSYRGTCRHIAAAAARYPAFWTPPAAPQPVSLRTTPADTSLLYDDGPEAA